MDKKKVAVPLVCHGHSRPVVDLFYSPITPDGFFLISASKDSHPMLRNGETGDWIGTFEGHKGAVWSSCLDNNALRAASASADFSAKLWDALTGDVLHSFEHKHIVRACAFSEDTKLLITGGFEKILRVFDLNRLDAPPTEVDKSPGSIRTLTWLHSDQTILSSCTDIGGVRLWDVRSGKIVQTLDRAKAENHSPTPSHLNGCWDPTRHFFLLPVNRRLSTAPFQIGSSVFRRHEYQYSSSFLRLVHTLMATMSKAQRTKPSPGSHRLVLLLIIFAFLLLLSSVISTGKLSLPYQQTLIDYFVTSPRGKRHHTLSDKYLYWGNRIDCPGKNCETCAGLGHQESSLRCALEEALFLNRTFVMPSGMCINPIHNKKGILDRSDDKATEEGWVGSSCAMDSLYDFDLISEKIPVILDDSKTWHLVLSTSMKLGGRGIAHVYGVSRHRLTESHYSNLLIINRTASPLAWFVECKDRGNRNAVMLPYSFLPNMAAANLRNAAEKIKTQLGDYDAIHVRRGDKLKTRKDRFGVERIQFPHLDRDTRPEFILHRIEKRIPPGRTLFIGSNERTPGFFSPLAVRYKLAYSSNFSEILDPIIKNNYQLFMVERLVMMGAKTFFKTFREYETDLTLTDDPKKNKNWEIPVYTMDERKESVS